MKRFPYTKDRMKQIFNDCPHKGFAKKCVSLIDGNVLDPAYHSAYIRPFSEIKNGNYTRPEWVPGYLQDYDLDMLGAPSYIRAFIKLPENRDTMFIVMHAYGFGWIIYTSERSIDAEGVRINTFKVYLMRSERRHYKVDLLLQWLKESIETEERYTLDKHGWPVYA